MDVIFVTDERAETRYINMRWSSSGSIDAHSAVPPDPILVTMRRCFGRSAQMF